MQKKGYAAIPKNNIVFTPAKILVEHEYIKIDGVVHQILDVAQKKYFLDSG
jgi:hypothetical protein